MEGRIVTDDSGRMWKAGVVSEIWNHGGNPGELSMRIFCVPTGIRKSHLSIANPESSVPRVHELHVPAALPPKKKNSLCPLAVGGFVEPPSCLGAVKRRKVVLSTN
jgi:hypothetical protein